MSQILINLPLTEYKAVVKPLIYPDFKDLEIEPNSAISTFYGSRLNELKEFCKHYPQFHIISLVNGSMHLNFVTQWANIFKLARGDRNPRLVSYQRICYEEYKLDKLIEFEASKFASVFETIMKTF